MTNQTMIIVPYRDRVSHLKTFITYITPKINADIFVIEQANIKSFNRGKLFNAGFIHYNMGYDTVIFHDVDMLPIGEFSYDNIEKPTHFATNAQQFGYRMPYDKYFGGVTGMSCVDFKVINGFGNEFWGWGAEDDELRNRVVNNGLKIESRPTRYRCMPHRRNIDTKLLADNTNLLSVGDTSGLHNCIFTVLDETDHGTHKILRVDI